MFRPKLLGRVTEFKRGDKAVQAGENTAVRAVILYGATAVDGGPFLVNILVAKLHSQPLASQIDILGALSVVFGLANIQAVEVFDGMIVRTNYEQRPVVSGVDGEENAFALQKLVAHDALSA